MDPGGRSRRHFFLCRLLALLSTLLSTFNQSSSRLHLCTGNAPEKTGPALQPADQSYECHGARFKQHRYSQPRSTRATPHYIAAQRLQRRPSRGIPGITSGVFLSPATNRACTRLKFAVPKWTIQLSETVQLPCCFASQGFKPLKEAIALGGRPPIVGSIRSVISTPPLCAPLAYSRTQQVNSDEELILRGPSSWVLSFKVRMSQESW